MFKRFKDNLINREDGFIVPLLFVLFYYAERISLFYWVRQLFSQKGLNEEENSTKKPFVKSYIFPEMWTIGNLIFAGVFAFYLLKLFPMKWLAMILLIIAVGRTFELIVYQINVLFFHRLNNIFLKTELDPPLNSNQNSELNSTENKVEYKIKSSTRTILLLLINMAEYIFQFAVIFAAIGIIADIPQMDIGMIKSFELFMNKSSLDSFLEVPFLLPFYIESLIGVFMNVLCIARFVGMFPAVNTIGYDNKK